MSEISVPSEWTDDLLQEHVADIMFDCWEELDEDCVLCQRAALAGFFDRFYHPEHGDPDPWLPRLKEKARVGYGAGEGEG